jgi:hypothetical protein
MRRVLVLSFLAAALASAGCLSRAHRVPKSELMRLSQTEPQQRGNHVRVVQSFQTSEQPPEAQPVRANSTVVVVGTGPRHHHVHNGGRRGGRGKPAKVKKDDAKAWIVVAILATVALATTEGARYDGWVQVHPMHPVHLKGYDGSYTWVPLAQLTPEIASSTEKAWLREGEGPWTRLQRAPLHRTGFNYSMLLGRGEIPSALDGSLGAGFMSHIQFGYFPQHTFGLLLDIGLGWRNNALNETIFAQRYAFEGQFLPLSAGKIHAGVFGQGGRALRIEDSTKGGTHQGTIYGAGGILQLELTTRLTLTARAGLSRFNDENTSDLTVGLSIY